MQSTRRSRPSAESFLLQRRWVAAEAADEKREQNLDHVVDGGQEPDRRLPGTALPHVDRYLLEPQPVSLDQHDRLDLRVIVRIVDGEQGNRLAVECLEARR